MEQWEINGFTLEFEPTTHTYLVDGVIVPSITQMLQVKFGGKYNGVSRATLENAAAKGTEVHEAIEHYCRYGEESELKEVRNFKFLQKQYGFAVINNEMPVILFRDGEPIAAGRLDLILDLGGFEYTLAIGDIKRTATLDKDYLAYQLNLYRIAYMQSYHTNIEYLKGIHLRDDIRKYVDIPINEGIAWEIVDLYFKEVEK